MDHNFEFKKASKPIKGMLIQKDGIGVVEIDCENGLIKCDNKIYDTNEIARIDINDDNHTSIIFVCRKES